MKVLILEDNADRIMKFVEQLSEHDLTIVNTASGMITQLEALDYFDVTFLDHDLGGEIYVNEKEKNTGSEVVRYIVDWGIPLPLGRVVIHSANIPASKNMSCDLKTAGYDVWLAPFHNIDWDMIHRVFE